MKVAVFGVGYVGSVTAACLAAGGHEVCGVDVDPLKVDMINAGHSPVVEPGLDDLVASTVAAGTLRATTDCAEALDGADVSLVCVGTPSTATGSTELAHLCNAVHDIAAALRVCRPPASGFHSVVIRSTVPPGTVENVVQPVFAAGGDVQVGTAMCPEFLREGTGLADFYAPPFVVVGTADDRVAAAVGELLAFVGEPVRAVDVRCAEALKYACNAYHAVKVSFANEMGRMFRPFGVDGRAMMELFCSDTTLNVSKAYLRPAFAFGGSCLPKDLRALLYLARMNSADMPLLQGTLASNELVVRDVVDRVAAESGRVVALLGLSFKSATDDVRESPNVELAERLLGKGYELRIYDSIVNPVDLVGANRRHLESKLPHLERLLTDTPLTALRGADLAIVSSTAESVRDALVAEPPRRVIDLSGRLGDRIEALPGYQGTGW